MYADNPILGEIRQGFKLRPTKTVDKSKPFFKKAEGEEEPTFNVVKLPPGGAAGTSSSSPAPYAAPPVPKSAPSAPKVPSTAPPPPSGAPPPPPPPMPGLPGAPPPPPPPAFNKTKAPALIKLGGATPADVDLGALLKSIHGGVRLRKTVTNDKSAAILNDDELKSKSIKMVEPTGPPPELMVPTPKPARTPSPATGRSSAAASSSGRSKSPRDRNHLAPDSEDERFHTPDEKIDSRYGTPEPPVDSPPVRRKTPEPPAKVKIDYTFEEKNLKVTSDDLKQEIPSGSAAAKIAKFMQASGNTGGGTVPRAAFRPSPIRSTFQKEVNNNLNVSSDAPKPKPASKWAPVEIGGLKRPSRGNVPFEKTDRAGSERPSVIRERSASALEEPISTDRARTQSPAAERATSTLPAPISVRTDFPEKPTKTTASPKKKPVIQETPPTPKTSTTSYSYNKNTRIASPTESESRTMSSPVSSMSSASLPSPSSISPGSTSPDSTPRRRINPGFDKAKEKFNGGATTPSSGGEGTLPLPRPFFLKNKMGDVHSKSSSPQSSPRGSISNNNEEKEAVKKAVKEAAARQKRVINVPISAPWHSPRDTSDSLRRTHRGIDPYSFVSTHPNDLRRNYRFDIDLSNDSPLSIFNR